MTGGSKVYHVTLTHDLFYKKGAPVFEEMRRLIGRFYDRYGKSQPGPVLMLTDRIARLPGINDMLAAIKNFSLIALPPGSGALGIIRSMRRLFEQQAGNRAPFLTSRPLPAEGPISPAEPKRRPEVQKQPSHILYHSLAYPITEKPLIIGHQRVDDGSGIRIQGQIAGVSRKHCAVQLQGNKVVLNDYSTYGTFVDENPVNGTMILLLGQTVRVGTPGENLKLIACLDKETDET